MNPQLSSLSQASALVIYVLSFSQETQTADYSLPLCSTLPCLWVILCFFPQYFSRSSNQVLFLFPWRLRKHCLKNQTNHLLGHHYLPHINMWASDPTDPREKGASDKNRNLPLLPPPCHWEGNLMVTFTHPVQKIPTCYGYSAAGDSLTAQS